MNKEVTTTSAGDVDVITAEQAALLNQIKAYDAAEEISSKHRKMFAYLKGRVANALKEYADSKMFTALLKSSFSDTKIRWIQYCMNFSEAVDRSKNAPVRFLSDDRLLTVSTISEKEKEQVADAVSKFTGDKGIKTVIAEWRKKVHKEKHKDEPAPSAADVAAQKMKAASDFVEELRSKMALALKNKNLALVPDAELDALEDDRIELGHYIASLRKGRKSLKSKA